jgi:hypothetical protein
MQDWLELRGEQASSLNLVYNRPLGKDTEEHDEQVNPFQCRLLLPCSKLTQLTSLSLGGFPVAFHKQQQSNGVSTRSRQRASTAQSLAADASSSNGKRGSGKRSNQQAAKLGKLPASFTPAAVTAGRDVASFLPVLRELLLSNCMVRQDSFLQLSQLTCLTSLHLHRVVLSTAAWTPVAEQQARTAFTAVLQQLQGLETLILGDGVILQGVERVMHEGGIILQEYTSAAALSVLSTMQRLQHLELSTGVCRTAAHLAHIPTGLTRLGLDGDEYDHDSSMGFLRLTPSVLPQLLLLRAVQLECVELDPTVLGCWSRCVSCHLSPGL